MTKNNDHVVLDETIKNQFVTYAEKNGYDASRLLNWLVIDFVIDAEMSEVKKYLAAKKAKKFRPVLQFLVFTAFTFLLILTIGKIL